MFNYLRGLKRKISGLIDSFYEMTPDSCKLVHSGRAQNDNLKFKKILIVDDIPPYVQNSLEVIASHYTSGEVLILLAYNYADALKFFEEEKPDLVILDMDLNDDLGDGRKLAEKYTKLYSPVVILANSKKRKSNDQLIKLGAVEALFKSKEKLKMWLGKHEPMPKLQSAGEAEILN